MNSTVFRKQHLNNTVCFLMDGTASIVHSTRVELAEHRLVTAIYTNCIIYPYHLYSVSDSGSVH